MRSVSEFTGATLIDLLQFRSNIEKDKKFFYFLNDGEDDESTMTLRELDFQARCIAASLQSRQAYQERALLLYPPGFDYISSYFGCLYAGTIAVPAYPPNPNRMEKTLPRLQGIIRDSWAKYILTTKMIASMADFICAMAPDLGDLEWVATDDLPKDLSQRWTEPDVNPDTTAFLQYTSGSTGDPKGVMVSHENLLVNLEQIFMAMNFKPNHIGMSWLPPYHDMGLIGCILHPLHANMPIVLMSPIDFLKRPFRWMKAISKYQAHISAAPNFAYDLCIQKISPEEREQLDLSSWYLALNGAERIRPQTIKNFTKYFEPCGFKETAFFPTYGLAEGTLMVSKSSRVDLPKEFSYQEPKINGEKQRSIDLVGCGKTISDHEIIIVDPVEAKVCEECVVGEVWVKGPSIAQGYWKRPELTEEVFRAKLKEEPQKKYLKTGDLGFLKDEELFITGRIKELIIIRGRNYYAQDLEISTEVSHQALRPGCGAAFSIEEDKKEKLVIVYEIERRYHQEGVVNPFVNKRTPNPKVEAFTPSLSEPPQFSEVMDAIRSKIAEEHDLTPSHVVLIKAGTVPKTTSGKIQRVKCKEMFLKGELSVISQWGVGLLALENIKETQGRPVKGEYEKYLGNIWAKNLEIIASKIQATDNIFHLGGDSLSIISIVGEISRELECPIDENIIYKHPTIEKLATYLESQLGSWEKVSVKTIKKDHYLKYMKPDSQVFPLEPLQQSFFINNQFGDTLCYVCGEIKFTGPIDADAFEKAIRISFKRHPSLNLAYRMGDEVPVQFYLEKPQNFKLETMDIRTLDEKQRDKALASGLEDISELNFDVESGENFKALLYQTGDEEFRLHVQINHLAVDGFSLPRYFNDLITNIYPAVLQKGIVEEAPLTSLNFKEYCEIKRGLKDVSKREEDIGFWLKRFKEFEPFPSLPQNGNVGQKNRFGLHWCLLDEETLKEITSIAKKNNTTLFSILFAIFFKLISQWANAQNLSINTPILNRRPYLTDISEILGCFTDILPVQMDSINETSLIDLAIKIQGELSDLLSHSSVSGVEIARLLAQTSKNKSNALSPIIFSSAIFPEFKNFKDTSIQRVTIEKIRTGAPATWLDVVMGKKNNGLFFSWNYNRSRFSGEFIQTLSDQFLEIIEKFIERPEVIQPLKGLISNKDLIAYSRLNQTEKDYGACRTLHERIEAVVSQSSEATALVHNGNNFSYGELNTKANQLAHQLIKLGVQSGEFVSVLCGRNFEFVVAILGILKAGAAYVPIDPFYPKERKNYILNDCQSKVLLVGGSHIHSALEEFKDEKCLENIVLLDEAPGGKEFSDKASRKNKIIPKEYQVSEWVHNPGLPNKINDVAYMIYTSGSTGNPKGVMVQHKAIDNRIRWMNETFPIGKGDKVAQKTTQSFDVSVWEYFWPLQQGSQMVLIDNECVKDPFRLHRTLKENNITIMHFVPSLMLVFLEAMEIVEASKLSLPNLKWVITSGEALPGEAVKGWQKYFPKIPIANLYGPTEAAVDVTYHLITEPRKDSIKPVPIGRPVANTKILILDNYGRLVPQGMAGEICLSGVQLAKGYWNREELTREKFTKNSVKEIFPEITCLYKTGDLGKLNSRGEIDYLGRLDHQVKIRGFRIELGEIEAFLLRHPEIKGAVVLAKGDPDGQKRLMSFIVADEKELSASDIKTYLAQKLPNYMVPAKYKFLKSIPLNGNGKADRKKLIQIEGV